MNILIVTSSYPPEIRSSSHLMQELAEEFALRGNQVTVVTSYPKVNLAQEVTGRSFKIYSRQNNINIIRTKTPVHPHEKSIFIIRGVSYLTLPFLFFLNIKKYIKSRLDAIIVYSPPLTLAIVGTLVKKAYGAKFVLNVQDIFPQNAIDLDILTNPLLIRFFKAIEGKAYADADAVTVHSMGNYRFLTQDNRCSVGKLSTLPNWIDLNSHKGSMMSCRLRDRFSLGNKFIFFFGGVMGPSQGLDVIIDAARELKDLEDIVFLLVGDGLEQERLKRRVNDHRMSNVIFGPFFDKNDYKALLQEVDVGLVCLSAKNKTPVVPGKLLGYMSAELPVLALLNRESDGHHIIREAACGCSAISDNPVRASRLMLKMYRNKKHLKQWGKNGLDYASLHFSKKHCVDKMEQLIR